MLAVHRLYVHGVGGVGIQVAEYVEPATRVSHKLSLGYAVILRLIGNAVTRRSTIERIFIQRLQHKLLL